MTCGKRTGHSLVEVVAGAAAAGVALLGLLSALLTSSRGSRQAYDETKLAAHAREVMERLAAIDFDDLLDQDGAVVDFADDARAEVAVIEVSPDLRSVRVQAFASGAPGRPFTLLTLRARRSG